MLARRYRLVLLSCASALDARGSPPSPALPHFQVPPPNLGWSSQANQLGANTLTMTAEDNHRSSSRQQYTLAFALRTRRPPSPQPHRLRQRSISRSSTRSRPMTPTPSASAADRRT